MVRRLLIAILIIAVLVAGCEEPERPTRVTKIPSQPIVIELPEEPIPPAADVEKEFINLLRSQPTDYSAEYVRDWSYKSTSNDWYNVRVSGGQIIDYASKTRHWFGGRETGCDTLFSGGMWVKHDCIVEVTVSFEDEYGRTAYRTELVENNTLPSEPPQTPDQEKKEQILGLLTDNEERPLGLKRISATLGRTCFYESEKKERTTVPYIYCFKDDLLVNYYYDIWSWKEDFSVVGYPADKLVNKVKMV